MRIRDIKDCKNCTHAIVVNNNGSYDVQCNCDDYAAKKLFKSNGRYCASKCKSFIEQEKGSRSNETSNLVKQNKMLQFITGGNSYFRLHSTKDNSDYMFYVKGGQGKFQVYKTNLEENIYCGTLFINFDSKEIVYKYGKDSEVEQDDIGVRSLVFICNKLLHNEEIKFLEFYHLNRCCSCGSVIPQGVNFNRYLCIRCDKHITENVDNRKG